MKDDFNILIVEDELIIAEMTKAMLLELKYNVLAIAKSYDEAQTYLSQSDEIDMAILDINLEEQKNGIDIGNDINEKYNIPFIYLTSYSDPKTIKNAALTTPAAYLLKPFSKSDLFTTIEMIKARKYQNDKQVLVKDGDLSIKVHANDILYVQSDNNYIDIITAQKKYVMRCTLDSFLKDLIDSNFIRIHRSYAVNILKVNAINGQNVIVGDVKCPLSRTHKEHALNIFLGS